MNNEVRYHVYAPSISEAPSEDVVWRDGTNVCRSIYNGNAAAILTTDDILHMEAMLERITDNTEEGVLDDEIEWLWEVIKTGRERMNKVHEALGAFSADIVGTMTKKESERIDWSESE